MSTANSVLNNSELEANFESKEIKLHLNNVMPVQFHSTKKELVVVDD